MARPTLGILLAGSLVAATAAMAIPVTPGPAHDGTTKNVQINWSHTKRSNGFVDDTWWALRTSCAPEYLGERLLCDTIGRLAGAASRTFEAKMSDDMGLPLVDLWGLMTAKNSPFVRSVHVETPLGLEAVLDFYRAALERRGWTENDGAVVEPDRAVVAFTTSDGPALLRLVRQGNTTIADLALRKPLAATARLQPAPGQARLLLGNKTEEAADVTVNERTIQLAARAGEGLIDFDDAADELPDRQKIDLSPGKYKITLKLKGSAVQKREFEVAANETWGLLVGPEGAPLPVRMY